MGAGRLQKGEGLVTGGLRQRSYPEVSVMDRGQGVSGSVCRVLPEQTLGRDLLASVSLPAT